MGGSEAEAWKVWWALHPTMADMFIFVIIVIGILIGVAIIKMIRGDIESTKQEVRDNKEERACQLTEIKQLVESYANEIRTSFIENSEHIKEVVDRLQMEKQQIQEHFVRHEKLADDITRIYQGLTDHEGRLRVIEHWDGGERRRRESRNNGI